MDNKYLAFLEKKVFEGTKSDFFKSMLERLQKGYQLTENMLKALDGAIEREERNTNPIKERKQLQMTKWWMRKQGFHSMVLNVEIEVETMKGYKVKGYCDVMKGCWCMRCGKELKQPASFTLGYGPDCAKKMGIPYPKSLNSMTADEIEKYREDLLGKLKDQVFEGWIPKSQVVGCFDILIENAS